MKIEPTALELFEAARTEWLARGKPVPPHQMEQVLLLSQAESLKRIADLLDGTTLGINVAETIFNPATIQNRDVRNHY